MRISNKLQLLCGGGLLAATLASTMSTANGQSFGAELQNNLMPASGGMAGTSLSRPQDLQSAIGGNASTLSQFKGTQFSFGGAWADVDYTVNQSASLPLIGVTPFNATSAAPGAMLGNIGLTQDLSQLGLPATLGIGLISAAGAGVDFRGVPGSNGTSANILDLDMVAGVGTDLTESLSLGASFKLGTAYLDGPFTAIGGMASDYAAQGTLGANYFVTECTSVGAYWQTQQSYTFNNAVVFPNGQAQNVMLDLPSTYGLGIANNRLMGGRLLVASDILFKQWSQADLFGGIYNDQWAFQFGTQYALTPRTRVRFGYAYNENPMKGPVVTSLGGVTLPDGIPAVRYVQGQFAAITQNRLTAGFGVKDFMLPGVDFDTFAGFNFNASDTFATTSVDVRNNYWIGSGITWRFGGCSTSRS